MTEFRTCKCCKNRKNITEYPLWLSSEKKRMERIEYCYNCMDEVKKEIDKYPNFKVPELFGGPDGIYDYKYGKGATKEEKDAVRKAEEELIMEQERLEREERRLIKVQITTVSTHVNTKTILNMFRRHFTKDVVTSKANRSVKLSSCITT